MTTYQRFIFKDYSFDKTSRRLDLFYSFDDAIKFTESYHFDFEFSDYTPEVLDRACQALFFMAGVSYYKAYKSTEIAIEKGQLDNLNAEFFSKTYRRGLGEFFYLNRLDPKTPVVFPTNVNALPLVKSKSHSQGLLVGIGGGKDSLVSVELLRNHIDNLATWSLGHKPQLEPLVERIGLSHYWVERQWDRSLLQHNAQGAMNGHIPISAIFACVGSIVAILSGRQDVIVSNEQSANEPTLRFQGIAINHQYSKSQEFEQDFQKFLLHNLGDSVRYYSFLRPLSEVYIAELFAHLGFEKYKAVFSSCNRAFVHSSNHIFWDGTCSKCAFIFLSFTPFISRQKLEELFSGKNLLLSRDLESTYRQLLGIEGDRPLDCVGEIKESRVAMRIAQKQYPELSKYTFEIPEGYDYHEPGRHLMPPDMFTILVSQLPSSIN